MINILKVLILYGIFDFSSYYVDALEINTNYDKEGNPTWRQLIAWKRFEDGKLHNVGWRFINNLSDFPTKVNNNWGISVYNNTEIIRVKSSFIINSHTQYDPEREDTNLYWKGEAPNIFTNKYNKVIIEYE